MSRSLRPSAFNIALSAIGLVAAAWILQFSGSLRATGEAQIYGGVAGSAAPGHALGFSTPTHVVARPAAPLPRPNFVVLIADDLGWDDLGVYGNRSVRTPNIDRLAAAGLRYDNAFLVSSSCSSSRASLLTGKYPQSNGLVHLHQSLDPKQPTLGRMLRDAGYYTAAAGKWHIGRGIKPQWDLVREDRSDPATRQWLDVLRQRPMDRPFFLWLASRDPHRPHGPTERSLAPAYDPAAVEPPPGFVDGPGTREAFANYYLEVSRFDRDVGSVIGALADQGVLENTLVVVMSDNGRPFHGGKQLIYDAGVKTPFILHWPAKIRRAGVRRQLISMVDLAPTLLHLAGAGPHPGLQGRSFAVTLDDPDAVIRDHVFAVRNWHDGDAHERTVRSLDFLYKENQFPLRGDCIRPPFGWTRAFREFAAAWRRGELDPVTAGCFEQTRPAVQLLAVDASGRAFSRNLAEDPAYAGTRATLASVLRRWRDLTGDFDYAPYTPPERTREKQPDTPG